MTNRNRALAWASAARGRRSPLPTSPSRRRARTSPRRRSAPTSLRARLRALEQPVVLGPLPARLQRPLPAARRAARARRPGRSPRSPPRRCSRRSPTANSAATGRHRASSARCGSRPRSSAWLLTGRLTFPLAVPFGLAALLAADAGRGPLPARSPRSRPWRARSPGCSPGSPALRSRLAGERRQGTWLALGVGDPDRSPSTSRSRSAASSRSCSRPSSRCRARRTRSGWCRPSTGRCGSAPSSTRRSRSPSSSSRRRSAATSPGSALCSPARSRRSSSGRAGARSCSRSRLPLLYWQLVAPVRDVRKAAGDDSTEAAFYEPLLAELDRLAAGAGRSGSRSRRPRTAGRPSTSPSATRSRAAGCASSSPTTSTCSRTATSTPRPTAIGSRTTRSPMSPSPTRRATSSPRTRPTLIDGGSTTSMPVWAGRGLGALPRRWHDRFRPRRAGRLGDRARCLHGRGRRGRASIRRRSSGAVLARRRR